VLATAVWLAVRWHGYWSPLSGAALFPWVLVSLVPLAALACLRPASAKYLWLMWSLSVAWLLLAHWAWPLMAFAVGVAALARLRTQLVLRCLFVVVLWLLLPMARWWWISPEAQAASLPLALLWGGLGFSAVMLLVERQRALQPANIWDDCFYLLAPPRLVAPFFQPISPTLFAGPPTPLDWRAAGRAVALAGYALMLSAFVYAAQSWLPTAPLWVAGPVQFLVYYAAAAFPIFLAVAWFRALGYPLPSGYRQPFLSQSFGDFFRRWNYFVRDAVLSVFYYPLLGLLRHRFKRRTTEVVAAYLAIALGAYVGVEWAVALSATTNPWQALTTLVRPSHVVMLLIYWSAIILPRGLGLRPHPQLGRPWRTLRFLLLYTALWGSAWWFHASASR